MAPEFWQHTSKTVKDFVPFDTAILLPRIYSEETIKGVSKDAEHSCGHNSTHTHKKRQKGNNQNVQQ